MSDANDLVGLRDEFAKLALTEIMKYAADEVSTEIANCDNPAMWKPVTAAAYAVADSMMQARLQPPRPAKVKRHEHCKPCKPADQPMGYCHGCEGLDE